MSDGSVTIDTKLNDDGFKNGLGKLGSIASKGLKGATVAIGSIATALTGVSIAATNSYADLEQNVGGVETLFKGSAEKVIKNAENAYKTAGMDANNYMATVTSFSASLLQSLGGDTEKAAESADMAIIDMSDNANKMGTAMQDIQNAYQGFAKQNYTMLDNLKLGYGGTKTEMERLLADAQKITGVKYDISNLNDVYTAIHVIQGELGITGTTAKEAASTISGSVNSMKSAFDNFLNGSGTIEQLVETGITATKNIMNAVEKLLPNIVQSIANATPQILEGINQIFPQALDLLTTNAPIIFSSISQILNTLLQVILEYAPQLIPIAIQLIQSFISGIVSMLPQILEAGIILLTELINGIVQMIPDLIPTAVDCIIKLVETLLDNIDMLIDAGIQLLIALAEGIIEALPRLIEKIPVIIDKLVNAIINNLPKILQMGITIIVKLAEGLIKAIPSLLAAIPQIVGTILEGLGQLVGKVFEIGKNIVKGIWDGISNMASWLWNKITGWCKGIVDGIKGFFGIHSPSTLFRDEIGENLGLGIGEGFKDSLSSVYRDMKQAVDSQNAKLTSNLSTKATLQVEKDQTGSVTNNNGHTINNTQNFYSKESTPFEEQKQAERQLRRLAYGL